MVSVRNISLSTGRNANFVPPRQPHSKQLGVPAPASIVIGGSMLAIRVIQEHPITNCFVNHVGKPQDLCASNVVKLRLRMRRVFCICA